MYQTKIDKTLAMNLHIDELVYRQVMHWVKKANGEVSGFGVVRLIQGQPVVTKAILLEQRNSGASTEISAKDIADSLYDLRNEEGDMRWWWHSHANMDVFWSGTDTDTIWDLGQHGWFFSTVFNKKAESRTAYYCHQPFPVFVDNMSLKIQSMMDPKILEEWDKTYDEKCRSSYQSYGGFPDYRHEYHGHKKSWRVDGETIRSTDSDGVEIDQFGNRWRWDKDTGWEYAGTVDGYPKKANGKQLSMIPNGDPTPIDHKEFDAGMYARMKNERMDQLITDLRRAGFSELDIEDEINRIRGAEGIV